MIKSQTNLNGKKPQFDTYQQQYNSTLVSKEPANYFIWDVQYCQVKISQRAIRVFLGRLKWSQIANPIEKAARVLDKRFLLNLYVNCYCYFFNALLEERFSESLNKA